MPLAPHPSARVLCLTLRNGSIGHVVLDGFGVAEGSFFTSRLGRLRPRSRYQALLRLISDSCRRFHPTAVVLGLPGTAGADRMARAERLARRIGRLRVAVYVRRLRDAARLFVERVRFTMADELVELLAKHFVPELTSYVARDHASPRYWRAAWYALAMGLSVLVERHPFDAAALAQSSAFQIPPFRAALAAALHAYPRTTV